MNLNHIIAITLTIFVISSSTAQNDVDPEVPYGVNPETPTQNYLEKLNLIPFQKLKVRIIERDKGIRIREYSLNGELFTGWTKQIFEGDAHKYRYMKMIKGYIVWQIGYYESGQLDADFHSKNAQNFGSQRMWRDDGVPYINNNFNENAELHGIQKRWHPNGQLEWEANYENGVLLNEKYYNEQGDLVEK